MLLPPFDQGSSTDKLTEMVASLWGPSAGLLNTTASPRSWT